jgi:uncharacterized protein
VRRRALLAGVAAVAVAVAAALPVIADRGDGDDYPAGLLRVATGPPGGVYHAYGTGLAEAVRRELPRLDPVVSATAASVQNLRLVGTGQAEVGFALADSAADAVLGRGSFSRPLPVVALARLYDNYLQLVVRADGPVRTLADLRGRRVDTGAAASGTEVTAARVLAVAGLDATRDLRRSRLGLDDAVAALAAGRIDAFFWSGGLPTAAVAGLARAVPVRLIPLDGTVRALRERFGDFYSETAVPATAYGLADAVGTVGVPNYLMVGAAMPAATAYRLTRLLFDRRPELVAAHPEARRLNLRSAIATYPVPLHPGAERCYRELSR